MGSKNFWSFQDPKNIWVKNNYGSEKSFGSERSWDPKKFESKKLWFWKLFGYHIFLGAKAPLQIARVTLSVLEWSKTYLKAITCHALMDLFEDISLWYIVFDIVRYSHILSDIVKYSLILRSESSSTNSTGLSFCHSLTDQKVQK